MTSSAGWESRPETTPSELEVANLVVPRTPQSLHPLVSLDCEHPSRSLPFTNTAVHPLISREEVKEFSARGVARDQALKKYHSEAVKVSRHLIGTADSAVIHGEVRQERRGGQWHDGCVPHVHENLWPDLHDHMEVKLRRPMRRMVHGKSYQTQGGNFITHPAPRKPGTPSGTAGGRRPGSEPLYGGTLDAEGSASRAYSPEPPPWWAERPETPGEAPMTWRSQDRRPGSSGSGRSAATNAVPISLQLSMGYEAPQSARIKGRRGQPRDRYKPQDWPAGPTPPASSRPATSSCLSSSSVASSRGARAAALERRQRGLMTDREQSSRAMLQAPQSLMLDLGSVASGDAGGRPFSERSYGADSRRRGPAAMASATMTPGDVGSDMGDLHIGGAGLGLGGSASSVTGSARSRPSSMGIVA